MSEYIRPAILRSLTPRAALGILWLLFLSCSGTRYTRVGSDIHLCGLTCPVPTGILELYRDPGRSYMLELFCNDLQHVKHPTFQSRLEVNASMGCWTLRDAHKGDSGTYVMEHFLSTSQQRVLTSTPISVLDPVIIYNIKETSSHQGVALNVEFSGEETEVTWQVNGGDLPDRYQLTDSNTTVIIPSGDSGGEFIVRVKNPVSEETEEYMLRLEDAGSALRTRILLVIPGVLLLIIILSVCAFVIRLTKTEGKESSDGDPDLMEGISPCTESKREAPDHDWKQSKKSSKLSSNIYNGNLVVYLGVQERGREG